MSASWCVFGLRRFAVLVAAGVILMSSACVPPAARSGSSGVATLVADRDGWRPDWSAADTARVHLAIPVGVLDGDSAVRLAILRSPRVRAVLEEVGIAQADLWQASLLPNPVSDFAYGFPAGSPAAVTAGVGFGIIRALQVPLRRRVVAAELAATERRVADAILGTATETQRAYTTVQHAQQMLELRQTVASAGAAAAAAAKALRDAGNVPVLTLVSEETIAAQTESDVLEAQGDLAGARAQLGRLLGAGVADTAWSIDLLLANPPAQDPSLALLDSLALARRLDVAAARESARAAAEAVGLASHFRLLADGTLGAFYQRDPDGRFIGPAANVPVPLFDQGNAAVARAHALLRQRVALHDALVVDAHADVRLRLGLLAAARMRAQQLRTVVLPLRRRMVEETQKHVSAMDLSVFVLLQARQAEIDAGRGYLNSLRDYWIARAELERATGGRLPVPATP